LGEEIGSILCTTDSEIPWRTSDQAPPKSLTPKKKVDADAHAARISTRGAVLRAAQQREWMAGVKLTFTVASMRLPSLTQ
jgi:hypothetical protein